MKSMPNKLIAIGTIAGMSMLMAFFGVRYLVGERADRENAGPAEVVPGPAVTISMESAASDAGRAEKKESSFSAKLPEKMLFDVPFTSQAPYANWDQFHEEACEEASLLMLVHYLRREKLDRETADQEIINLITFQVREYGGFEDSSARAIVDLARDYYKLDNLKVVYDFGPQELKKELAKGNPVILPVAGRLLGNPNFKTPGPLYHVLILIGYDGDTMITNDPGTRKGRHYEYPLDTLYSAIHDFPGDKEKITGGRKAMVVVVEGENK